MGCCVKRGAVYVTIGLICHGDHGKTRFSRQQDAAWSVHHVCFFVANCLFYVPTGTGTGTHVEEQ